MRITEPKITKIDTNKNETLHLFPPEGGGGVDVGGVTEAGGLTAAEGNGGSTTSAASNTGIGANAGGCARGSLISPISPCGPTCTGSM